MWILMALAPAGLRSGYGGSHGVFRQTSRLRACSTAPLVPLLPKFPAMSGPVAKGFQRGSAKLGFPTANLPCSLFQDALANLDAGVYVGWAGLRGGVHKCVCNVGFSPSFVGNENPEKILEAHIIAGEQEVPKDFYGEQLRILLLGYIRPERRFDFSNGPGELIAAITDDVATASAALDAPPMNKYKLVAWLMDKGEGATYELMNPDTVR